jgi:hypothetical protein
MLVLISGSLSTQICQVIDRGWLTALALTVIITPSLTAAIALMP